MPVSKKPRDKRAAARPPGGRKSTKFKYVPPLTREDHMNNRPGSPAVQDAKYEMVAEAIRAELVKQGLGSARVATVVGHALLRAAPPLLAIMSHLFEREARITFITELQNPTDGEFDLLGVTTMRPTPGFPAKTDQEWLAFMEKVTDFISGGPPSKILTIPEPQADPPAAGG